SAKTDPYLADHRFQGQQLMPAVIGLEAMAQVAMAVTGNAERPCFEDVRFDRPIAVPDGGTITFRSAALVREVGRVDVVLRTRETGFHVDHFRATCRFPRPVESPDFEERPTDCADNLGANGVADPALVRLNVETDLYEALLFQSGRFRCVKRYRL